MAASEGPATTATSTLPHRFRRRILLAVLGPASQPLASTLYTLVVPVEGGPPPFVPTAIHVVTTAGGRDRARRELLDPENGWFFRFCRDCRLDPRAIAFGDESFIVVERDGGPVEDAVTAADLAAVAATVFRLVRRLTADDGAAVHASLSGGRRTMGFYLGHALSLYARPQDRLSHVLIDSPFAAATDWSRYPHPAPTAAAPAGPTLDTSAPRIRLVDVPIVRLRDQLPFRAIDALPPPGAPGRRPSPALARPALAVHCRRALLIVGGDSVRLRPADFAFYAVLARRRADGRGFVNHRTPDLAAEYLREYVRATGSTADRWAPNVERVRRRLRNGADRQWFEQRKARVNHVLRAALGAWVSRPYQIGAEGRRPDTRFGVLVDPARIVFPDD